MLIKKGAEAELYRGRWMEREVIIKRRIAKPYRNPDLDRYIRTTRTSLEAKSLANARTLGVPTPIVYDVNLDEAEIIMSYIPGPPLKNVLPNLNDRKLKELFIEVGRLVGILHKGGIVHGDLTTSNMLLQDDRIFFIDFGLSEYTCDIEARGVDIHLMRRALESSHYLYSELAYESFILGYKEIMKEEAIDILKRVEEIRKRGRYVGRHS
ncbi:MAG: KEOPS complex kinase/ATPase Bud32 [Candidatus Methanomethyliaceae archaeon]|nr:KEOPS complex kinase/ATPase Bud32 [Candidatus Methanomethyliaceae archaeon]MDW7970396.1 KEOPS complex kinase/ATPase Bud32 [Nitrososphaerota archaeon]